MRIYTLGRFRIEIDGSPLSLGARGHRKPLELLKVLIALGGRDVPELQLSDALWPDSEGDHAHRTFLTNLHRLRKLIGHQAVQSEDGRVTLLRQRCWVDTDVFSVELEGAAGAVEENADAVAWNHMEKALALYRGQFLEGEFDPPEILSARERLHSMLLRHVGLLGGYVEGREQLEKAILLYQRGLEIDDLAEELYQRLMRCYRRQGRLAEGIAVYQRCSSILRAKLGLDPSPETDRVYHSLVTEKSESPSGAPQETPPASRMEPQHSQRPSTLPDSSRARGEQKVATVAVFALSDLSALNECLDPEEVETLMLHLKVEVERTVEQHGGILNQSFGEKWVCPFGIPSAHEDDPVRAVRAAQKVHDIVRRLGSQYEDRIRQPLRMCTGIDTGLLRIHAGGGSDGRFGIFGEAVNSGVRLAEQAEADHILIAPETQTRIEPFFETESLKSGRRKGTAKAVTAFRIVAETGVETPFEAAERRGFTPFVGRERELEILNDCLAKTVAGQGQFVTVVGEAGVGKSRLVYEFRQGLDRNRVAVIQGRCQSYGTPMPYLPLLDAMRRGLQLREEEDPSRLADSVVQRVRDIDPSLEQYLPHYLHLLSIPSDDFLLPETLQGEERRQALQEAIAAMYALSAQRKPLVCIMEDWHWADEASNGAMGHLLGLIPNFPLLFVVIYRPEFTHSWGGPEQTTSIVLKPLDEPQSECIARSVIKAEELPEGLGTLIYERTGGNPFFVEEIGRSLLEEGTVSVESGSAVITRELDAGHIPDSVQAVIRTRVDRLDPDLLEVLQAASVIGREFARQILEWVNPDPATLSANLERLRAQDLIQQVRVVPEPEFSFKHVLIQVVAYETLLIERRKVLHELVGRTLEERYIDRLEEHYEALAYHFRKSTETEKAIHYLELAGDKAAQYFSLVEARKYYREAIRLLDATESTPERMMIRIDLTLSWAAVGFYSPSEAIVNVLDASLNFAEQIQDETRLAKVVYWMGRTHFSLGNMRQAQSLFERCIGIAEGLADKELLALPYNIMGRSFWYTAEHSKGIEVLEKGILMMERLGNMDEVAYSTAYLGNLCCWTGDFSRASPLAEKALEIATGTGNLTREAQMESEVSFVRIVRGDWATALDPGTRSVDIAQRIGNVVTAGYSMGWKGIANFMLGRREEGIQLMREGGNLIEETGSHLTLSIIYGWLAESYAVSSDLENAIVYADKVLDMRLVSDKVGETMAYRALALAASLESPPDWGKVEDYIEKSILLSRERGERPNLGIGYFRYAELLHKKMILPEAREQLDQADALFRDMEMTWWLEQAESLWGRLETGTPFEGFAPYAE